jgi:hypothetical protein
LIPSSFIQAWSAKAPWPDSRLVEQDLIICRALCDLFNAPALNGKIAFRGGTAINKLLFKQPLRYSEDIDLVQTRAEPIGTTVDAIRDALSWLGKCSREQAGHSMHVVFDLHRGLQQLVLDPEKLIRCFDHYLALEDKPISRAVAERRMLEKLTRSLTEDIAPLLPAGVRFNDGDATQAFERVWKELITRISGDPWKLTDKVLEELRTKKYPGLLSR